MHVTEALGGGVCSLLSSIAKLQAKSYRVILIHSIRSSSPSAQELKRLFPEPIELIPLQMVTNISVYSDSLSLLHLLKILKKINPAVIHLHSSKAGVLGRVAARLIGMSDRVFYSPHGLSFLRQDISTSKRRIFWSLEWLASKIGGMILASSKSEMLILHHDLGVKNLKCISNGVDFSNIKKSGVGCTERVRVITTGRITYAKAPWKFKEIVLATQNSNVDFIWAGDGELRDKVFPRNEIIPNLTILGWVENGDSILDELAKSHIFLLTSLWEGMPISLLEAQAAGLPAIVSNTVGSRDVVLNDVTGFVCDSIQAMAEKIQLLVGDSELRAKMGAEASKRALELFSIDRVHLELLEIYGV